MKMKSITIKKSNLLASLFVMLIIISINFYLGSTFRENFNNVPWFIDDALHIGIANSFSEQQNFKSSFLSAEYHQSFSIDQIIENRPILSGEQSGKGPMYYILLGSFYELLQTSPKDFFFHGSIFNNILTSLFVILFFFFVKKHFDFKIAFISSILILMIPYFAMISARVLLYPLLFIFSISALFFIDKKKSHYVVFGILTGLALLTHPFGIFLPISYFLFLLIKQEFKGFLLTAVSLNLVLLPWLLRNYYFFGDAWSGFYFPFSKKISDILFSFLPRPEFIPQTSSYPFFENSLINFGNPKFSLFNVFTELFDLISSQHYMDYLLILVLILSGFTFFKLANLKNNAKNFIIIISAIAISSFLLYYFPSTYAQIAYAFVIPIIFVFFLYKKKRHLFEKIIPRSYLIIIFFVFVSLIAYYLLAVNEGRIPHPKILLFSLLLTIPLAIYGYKKLFREILGNRQLNHWLVMPILFTVLANVIIYYSMILLSNNNEILTYQILAIIIITPCTFLLTFKLFTKISMDVKKEYANLIPIIILVFILSPIVIQTSDGIKAMTWWPNETGDMKIINEFVRNNVDQKENISSNLAGYTNLRTGLKSMALPVQEPHQLDLEKLFQHFRISYVIFYSQPDYYYGFNPLLKIAEYQNIYQDFKTWETWNYYYDEVFSVGNSHVFKINDALDTADISNPLVYLHKGVLLENEGMVTEANKIYDEIRNYEFSENFVDIEQCRSYTYSKNFGKSIDTCTKLLEKDPSSFIVLENLGISFESTGQIESTFKILDLYNEFIENPENTDFLKSWGSMINYLIEKDISYNVVKTKFISDTIHKTKEFETQGNLYDALFYLQKLDHSDSITIDSSELKIRILTKLKKYEEALKTYDTTIELYKKKIENREQDILSKKLNEIQKSLIKVLNGKATLLIDLEEYYKAQKEYIEIISIDKFNFNAWENNAILLEKSGRLKEALYAYQFLNQFEGETQITLEKIEELENRIGIISNQK